MTESINDSETATSYIKDENRSDIKYSRVAHATVIVPVLSP